MKKILAFFLVALIMLNFLSTAVAQEEDCDEEGEECVSCRNNNFYYVLMAGLLVFTIFFYWRNREKIG